MFEVVTNEKHRLGSDAYYWVLRSAAFKGYDTESLQFTPHEIASAIKRFERNKRYLAGPPATPFEKFVLWLRGF